MIEGKSGEYGVIEAQRGVFVERGSYLIWIVLILSMMRKEATTGGFGETAGYRRAGVKYTSGELFFESQHTSQREPLKGKSEHISLLFTIPISLSVKAKILTMAYKALNIMLSPAPPSTLTSSLTVIL